MKSSNRSVRFKLIAGFATLMLMLVVSIGLGFRQAGLSQQLTRDILESSVPASEACLRLIAGLQKSIAAMRGWIIVGDESYRQDRGEAWSQLIQPSMVRLGSIEAVSGDGVNPAGRLGRIRARLEELAELQAQVETIARTPENEPARLLVNTRIDPLVVGMFKNITMMIDVEQNETPSAERRDLLQSMADVRGTLGLSYARLREYALSGQPGDKEAFEALWKKNGIRFHFLEEHASLLSGDQAPSFQELKTHRAALESLPAEVFRLRESPGWNQSLQLLAERVVPVAAELTRSLDGLSLAQAGRVQTGSRELSRTQSGLARFQGLLLATGGLLAIVLTVVVTRSITRPLRGIADLLEGGAGETTGASAQLSAASQSVARGSSTQAASLEEVNASLLEMRSMIESSASRATTARELATSACGAADKGAVRVASMLEAMRNMEQTNSTIVRIVKSIDEIAFQTNILALNAAVEAARAGQAGLGFSVVAEEVRSLAQRSAKASRETGQQIHEVVEINRAGLQGAEEVARSLGDIVARARELDGVVVEIADALKQQTQGVRQITESVTHLDEITQTNAATAEETAAAAASVDLFARKLLDSVHSLRDVVEGSSRQP